MTELTRVHAGVSNSLLQSTHNLSTIERRIILITLCKIKSKNPIEAGTFYEVDLDMYKQSCDVEIDGLYNNIKAALKKLIEKQFVITEGNSTIIGHWVPSIKYNNSEGKVYLSFGKEIIPHISELKKQFTRLYARDALPIEGKYTYRLYSMIEMYRYKGLQGKLIVEIKDLMTNWCIPESKKEFKFFKRDILVPAVKEFNTRKLGILDVKYIKSGRNIEKIEFIYTLECHAAKDEL